MAANSSSRSTKRELEHVRFEPAEDGAMSTASFKVKRGGQGGGPTHDYESDKPVIHPTLKHAQDHLATVMGDCFASEEEPGKEED